MTDATWRERIAAKHTAASATVTSAVMRERLRFKIIDITHGVRCGGIVLLASDGIICLLCGKEWESYPEGEPPMTRWCGCRRTDGDEGESHE